MNDHADHARFEDDLAAYLLDALTADEVREIERHIEGCERCQERARWLQGSVEMLPTAVEQLEPPPALRERLMRTVRAEAGVSARERPAAAGAGSDRDARSHGGRGWLSRLFALPRPAMALGAILLAVGAGGLGYAVGTGGDAGEPTTIQAEVAPPGAHVTLERDGDRGILRVSGLPQHSNRIYEVWLERGGQARPATLFQVHRDGTGSAAIPHGLNGADRVMVSLEPPGGSAQPTSDPVVVTDI
ncbi:MAG: anti-sigma factor domain-containing protein [Solirubrobacterales bacterium]